MRTPCKRNHEPTDSKLQSCTYFCALKECSYFDVCMLYRVAIEIILVVTINFKTYPYDKHYISDQDPDYQWLNFIPYELSYRSIII